jgi:hypothetical protein
VSTRNRRRLAILCLAAIVISRIQPNYVWRPFFDFATLKTEYARWADWWPQYPPFLDEVRAHTRNGDSVVIIAPVKSWNAGYAYAFFRGSYFLAGRRVLPYVSYEKVLHPENVRAVQYVAVYRTDAPPESPANVVWRGKFGELLRR